MSLNTRVRVRGACVGLITFLRHITIESIDLTEQVFLGAQAALEYANTCLADDAPKARHGQKRS